MEKFEIFFVRHGDTSGMESEGRERCDIGLNENGKNQAELLAQRLKGFSFDAVFSSPLYRCVQTASLVCHQLSGQTTIELLPELVETDTTKDYDGCGLEELKKVYSRVCFCPERICENGFFPSDFADNVRRARKVADYFQNRFTYGQRILIFCHGSFGGLFIKAAAGLESENILSLHNTSLSKIKYTEDGKIRLSFLNDISHLRSLLPYYELEE